MKKMIFEHTLTKFLADRISKECYQRMEGTVKLEVIREGSLYVYEYNYS
jgi:hypothetical protein